MCVIFFPVGKRVMFSRKDIRISFLSIHFYPQHKLICVLHSLAHGFEEYHKNMYLKQPRNNSTFDMKAPDSHHDDAPIFHLDM